MNESEGEMTAEHCMFWQGEGCICEILTRIRCKGMTKDIIAQCKLTDEGLVEAED